MLMTKLAEGESMVPQGKMNDSDRLKDGLSKIINVV